MSSKSRKNIKKKKKTLKRRKNKKKRKKTLKRTRQVKLVIGTVQAKESP